MVAAVFRSPFQFVVAKRGSLALTPDQRRGLEKLELDFQREALSLSNERQLLLIDVRQARSNSPSGLALAPDSLAKVDALTVKLRQAWLSAQAQALAILTADQRAKLSFDDSRLPGFGSDLDMPEVPEPDAAVAAKLDARIAEVVAARLKDAKVVEIETAQAIAERLFSWAKTAAILIGIPLALLAVILSVLGISNWTDFTRHVADGKAAIDSHIATAKKDLDTLETQAAVIRNKYADLQGKLNAVSTLSGKVSDLASKVKILEHQVKVRKTSLVPPQTIKDVEKKVQDFSIFVESIGYHPPPTLLEIVVDDTSPMNAYYDGLNLVIGPKLMNIPEALYHEYLQFMLKETNSTYFGSSSWKMKAIGAGLADYFSCSYLGAPKFGESFVKMFGEQLPAEFKRGYLRNLANQRMFVADSATAVDQEAHNAGEAWGGVFWDARTILGCKPDVAKCETADKILLKSWRTLSANPPDTADVRFARSIVQIVRESASADAADKVRDAFERRGLHLPQE